MNSLEFLDWLKNNNLLEKAKENAFYFKKVIKNCLDPTNEEFLILTDTGIDNNFIAPIIAAGYYFAAQDLGIKPKIVAQEVRLKGDTTENDVYNELVNLNRGNIIVMVMSGKLGGIKGLGKSFRTYASENYHRFISSTSLGKLPMEKLPDVIKSINVDYEKMHERGIKLKEKLDNAEVVRIKTELGTDLYIGIKGKEAILNTGHYKKMRTGGNVPAGEVYIPPKWKDVNGTLVIDGSSAYQKGTQLIKTPITLIIKDGEIVDIKGEKEADNLRETLEWAEKKAKFPWGIRRIGELGIGINPNADIIGSTIVDEKSLGTCHIGIGSNYWFGGTIYAIIHLDQIIKNPKIYLDGKLIEV